MLPHAADAGGSGTSGVAFVLAVAGALILALVLAEIVAAALRAVGRRHWLPAFLARRTRMPVRTLLAVVGVWVGVGLVGDRLPGWFEQADTHPDTDDGEQGADRHAGTAGQEGRQPVTAADGAQGGGDNLGEDERKD